MAGEQKPIKVSEQQLINAFSGERQNLEALQSNLASIDARLRDVLAATDALNEIKKAKVGEKMLVPLGAGILIDASIESNSTAKNTFAGGVVANVAIEDALKDLAGKKQEIEKAISEMQNGQEKIVANLNSIGTMLRTIEQKKNERAQK